MKYLKITLWIMSIVVLVLGIILKNKILFAIVAFGYVIYWLLYSLQEYRKRKKE